MKRSTLLQHLRKHGCTLKREGLADCAVAYCAT